MSEALVRRIVQGLAAASLALGAFGMLFCFPSLWSSKMENLVGAGFPFVGGAVLFGCGLVALALTVQSVPDVEGGALTDREAGRDATQRED